jgi:hypothetical protein
MFCAQARRLKGRRGLRLEVVKPALGSTSKSLF